MDNNTFYHQSVLLHECIQNLNIQPDGVYLDATFGGGGHSKEILKHLGPKGKLLVFDQDEDAMKNIPTDEHRIIFIRENFRYANRFVRMHGLKLNGVLADLGVSSYQFDTAERGFSTRFDAQLDMRMDQRNPKTAVEVLNNYSESELQQLFEEYGEVTNSKPLAKKIVEVRSSLTLNTINEFKQAISNEIYGNPNKYLAQVFQALRIEVNEELKSLQEFVDTIPSCMALNGRICIITFHSLEDRIVKQSFKSHSDANDEIQSSHDELIFGKKKKEKSLIPSLYAFKKPIVPTEKEIKENSRARSAKLRVAEWK
jgi:16S rRNA (cytosine1402-N4)-methyltransferase